MVTMNAIQLMDVLMLGLSQRIYQRLGALAVDIPMTVTQPKRSNPMVTMEEVRLALEDEFGLPHTGPNATGQRGICTGHSSTQRGQWPSMIRQC